MQIPKKHNILIDLDSKRSQILKIAILVFSFTTLSFSIINYLNHKYYLSIIEFFSSVFFAILFFILIKYKKHKTISIIYIIAAIAIIYSLFSQSNLHPSAFVLGALIPLISFLLFGLRIGNVISILFTCGAAFFFISFQIKGPQGVAPIFGVNLLALYGLIICLTWFYEKFRDDTENNLIEDIKQRIDSEKDLEGYFDAIEASTDIIAIIDKEYRYTLVNKAFLKQQNLERKDIIGKTVSEVLNDKDFIRIKPHVDNCFMGKDVTYEMDFTYEHLGTRNLYIQYIPILEIDNSIKKIAAIIKDITEYHQIQEEKTRIFNLSHDPMCIITYDGIYKTVNPSWKRLFGWDYDDMKNKSWAAFIHPKHSEESTSVFNNLLKGEVVFNFENQFLKKDNTFHWLSWTAVPVPEQKLIYATAHDISQYKEYQRKIKVNEDRLDSLLLLSNQMKSNTEVIQRFALEEAVRITTSEVGYFHIVNEESETIDLTMWSIDTLKKCSAQKTTHYPINDAGIWADSIRLKKAVVHNDYSTELNKKGYPEGHFPLIRHLSVPIFSEGSVVAVIGVGNKAELYDDTDEIQLTLFANNLWSILEQKKAQELIKKHSVEDSLTGLNNRRELNRTLQSEWFRTMREKQFLSVLMIDVDFFKQYNDTYGHQEGDNCLKSIALVLQKSIHRTSDFIARYGGEEFIVVLPNTDIEGAKVVAQNIQKNISLLNIPHKTSSISQNITASIGISTVIPQSTMKYDDLIKSADNALYEAKSNGRNKIETLEII